MKKICVVCGKEFETQSKKQIYCGDKCRNRKFTTIYNQRYKLAHPTQTCPICGKEFVPKRVNQKTCGNKKCTSTFCHNGVKPKRKIRRKNMSDKTWNKLSPSDRWEIMTLAEVDKECKRFHLSYGQMQCLYHSNKLPENFGKRGVE